MRMFVRFVYGCVIPAFVSLVIVMPAGAQGVVQQAPAATPPFIAASAVGESRITPDRAMVQVEVRNIDIVGKVIDAALGAGATNIEQVGLYPSSTESARREAVQQAVAKARGEAEAAAAAAGGSLGAMIELVIDPGSVPRPMLQQVMLTGATYENGALSPAAYSTPVEPGEAVVTAGVRIRWQFVGQSR